jgi:N-acetylglucosaminyldiphosphoundecaprenol N-acetyl-beta-D-mannosaminyltransferase
MTQEAAPSAPSRIQDYGMKTINLLGTPLTATSYEEFTDYCRELSREAHALAVDLTNTHIVTMRRHDRHFREITSRFDFFLPDGMPLVWSLNRRGAQMRDRVYGPAFMRCLFTQTPAPYKHYLLGGSPECLTRLQQRLLTIQPALRVVGARHGYFRADEEDDIVREINRLSPDFIWVGLGTPKQQEWIYRNKSRIHRGVIFAVGFAFDVNAGSKPDAPEWMQRAGLTWLFRLLSEPRRLAVRYLRYNTLFVFYLCKDALFKRRS